MLNILVVEDDIKLNQIFCTYLCNNGYDAKGCLNPREAYDLMYNTLYDLIISDVMMPEIDGFEFAETVRAINKTIPILFVTARDDISSKQKGFRAGIDDYMVKPVNMDEMVLRVGALLRRANIAHERRLTVGGLVMDGDEMTATLNGSDIPVTVREFNILYKMLSYPKHTYSRAQLMDEFWGLDSETSLRAVDVYIAKLRDKFSACEDFKIVTVHGLGYKAVLQ
ncbi:response regulator transcription factor [Paenibacillus sp. HW567]|uniref:response regulator transcription factor n=1 Tax=Paenibacillus sp. HW567 TaxID=1034769 RepID=UPI000363750C|nr:response regulator transcription factor [Paenibacillus sp. HW567]